MLTQVGATPAVRGRWRDPLAGGAVDPDDRRRRANRQQQFDVGRSSVLMSRCRSVGSTLPDRPAAAGGHLPRSARQLHWCGMNDTLGKVQLGSQTITRFATTEKARRWHSRRVDGPRVQGYDSVGLAARYEINAQSTSKEVIHSVKTSAIGVDRRCVWAALLLVLFAEPIDAFDSTTTCTVPLNHASAAQVCVVLRKHFPNIDIEGVDRPNFHAVHFLLTDPRRLLILDRIMQLDGCSTDDRLRILRRERDRWSP